MYKRQASIKAELYGRKKNSIYCMHSRKSVLQRMCEVSGRSYGTGAVSYTHLDVYKRQFLFRLRNEDEVRKNSFQTSEIPYSSHENWFAQKLQDVNTVIYILERNGQAIGQIRADRRERTAEISYALCSEARGLSLIHI